MMNFNRAPRPQKQAETTKESEPLSELAEVARVMKSKVEALPPPDPQALKGEASDSLRETIAEVTEGREG